MIQKALILSKTSKEKTVDENPKESGTQQVIGRCPVSPKTIFRVRGYEEYNDGFTEELYDEFYLNYDEARKAFDQYVDGYFKNTTKNISPDDWSLTESDPPRCFGCREGTLAVFCGSEEEDICYYIILSEIKLL